jgi:hypothetical protein
LVARSVSKKKSRISSLVEYISHQQTFIAAMLDSIPTRLSLFLLPAGNLMRIILP